MKRKIASAALVTSLLTALMLPLSAGPAAAAPTGCYAGGGFTFTTAYCSGGTGAYQAAAICQQSFWPYHSKHVVSDWKAARSGQTPWAWCPLTYNVVARWVNLRN
jgi:hypothetical protein